jgi:hypothetical protein
MCLTPLATNAQYHAIRDGRLSKNIGIQISAHSNIFARKLLSIDGAEKYKLGHSA